MYICTYMHIYYIVVTWNGNVPYVTPVLINVPLTETLKYSKLAYYTIR